MYINSQCILAGSKPQNFFVLHFVLSSTIVFKFDWTKQNFFNDESIEWIIIYLFCRVYSMCPETSLPLVLSWVTVEEHKDNNWISSGLVLRVVCALTWVIRPKCDLHTKIFSWEVHSIFDFLLNLFNYYDKFIIIWIIIYEKLLSFLLTLKQ